MSRSPLRRVFDEQFEVVEGKRELTTKRPSGAVQNPHDPDARYADKGTKQWIGYNKVHVVESTAPPSRRSRHLRG